MSVLSLLDTVTAGSELRVATARVRLEYLDGLRGLAALFVVFHHAYAEMQYRFPNHEVPAVFIKPLKFLAWGHFSVDLFIVLSGYCLMLPVARRADGLLVGGFWSYLARRARRILPPYYAALALSLLLLTLLPHLRMATSPDWNHPLVAFTPGVLLSHLLLIHNLSPGWIYRIDHPMWSVATEWQIYFVFPLILLPVWRRAGIAAAVFTGFAVGLAPHFLLPAAKNLDQACYWYIGLFALGMAAALLSFSALPSLVAWRERISWGWVAAVPGVILLLLGLARNGLAKEARWLTDPVVGFAAAALLVACTRLLARNGPIPLFLRLLESRPILWLGTFSYSLYLVHYPLLGLGNTLLAADHLRPAAFFLISLLGIAPLTLPAAYLFHLAFERPFMVSRR